MILWTALILSILTNLYLLGLLELSNRRATRLKGIIKENCWKGKP